MRPFPFACLNELFVDSILLRVVDELSRQVACVEAFYHTTLHTWNLRTRLKIPSERTWASIRHIAVHAPLSIMPDMKNYGDGALSIRVPASKFSGECRN